MELVIRRQCNKVPDQNHIYSNTTIRLKYFMIIRNGAMKQSIINKTTHAFCPPLQG